VLERIGGREEGHLIIVVAIVREDEAEVLDDFAAAMAWVWCI